MHQLYLTFIFCSAGPTPGSTTTSSPTVSPCQSTRIFTSRYVRCSAPYSNYLLMCCNKVPVVLVSINCKDFQTFSFVLAIFVNFIRPCNFCSRSKSSIFHFKLDGKCQFSKSINGIRRLGISENEKQNTFYSILLKVTIFLIKK